MERTLTRSWRRRTFAGAVSIGAATVLIAGCTGRGGGGVPWRTTTTTWGTTPTTDCHGHTDQDHANRTTTTMDHGMDHGGGGMDHHGSTGNPPPCNPSTTMPGGGHDGGDGHHGGGPRTDHPPTEGQKQWSRDLVAYTKWALTEREWPNNTQLRGVRGIPNKAAARTLGYNDIGDGVHFTHPQYRVDGKEFDPRAIESLVFNRATGEIQAAMYNMERSTTAANVPDWAGNWTVWHGHDNLCWSAPEGQPGWTRLGGVKVNGRCTAGSYAHVPVLMVHVWVTDTRYETNCGAFASIDGIGEGSCVREFQQNPIAAKQPPPYSRANSATAFPGQPRI